MPSGDKVLHQRWGEQGGPAWGGPFSKLQEHSGYLCSVGHHRWGRPCGRSCSSSCCDSTNSSEYIGGSNFHRRLAEEADHIPNIERTVDEGFHLEACLRVPDVEVDCACVGPPRIVNNPGWGSKANAVLVDRRGDDEGGIL